MHKDSGEPLLNFYHVMRFKTKKQPYETKGPISWKYVLAPAALCIAVVVLVSAISLSLQVHIQPTGLGALNISGGPGIGDYDVFFALIDDNNVNGPSSGYVYFKIFDANQTVLYRSEFQIRAYNFMTYYNYTSGPPLVGYRWVIPLENVSAGIPSGEGMGTAEFLFLAISGSSMESTINVPIPVALH